MKLRNILLFSLLFIGLMVNAQKKIVILGTNDTHSRIEPIPENDKSYGGMGGVVAREAFIEGIRNQNKNVLLFDAGDFVQGTPYFNLFHGRVEAQAMNLMKYDAGTLGNHEFDYGLDTLKMIVKKLNFPILNCNYDFSKTVLKDDIKPYVILKRFGLKIGVLGVGVDPEGLVQKNKYEGMEFKPAISSVNFYAKILKDSKKCDLVVCLSHLGYNDDIKLAEQSKNVDIIIGGHSHTYMEKPDMRTNLDGKEVLIFQTGKSGAYVNKIEVELDKIKK
ncbi:bifunctional metallophosphatase/5'-nucleotidase [Dysgonomonas sp. HDW5A]|uniref:bifunctional metallophosphatase/5'-nucleotidase n=1 Tax=Dysgonomonas sp. HDW5A TaxID=2714926 RepID=UPI00140D8B45|nr:metallophosphatase [Dysgonomonas sp. HDW5A]QIK59885.1 bifunctional metallophosphatase/5'-nucleotidase [Dysgonomonas sp. HDW5A]